MRESLQSTTKGSRWKNCAILLLLLSCRESTSYVPVDVLTASPIKSRRGFSDRQALQGRKRGRVESSRSIIRLPVHLNEVASFNTTTDVIPDRVNVNDQRLDPAQASTSTPKSLPFTLPRGDSIAKKKDTFVTPPYVKPTKATVPEIPTPVTLIDISRQSDADVTVKKEKYVIEITCEETNSDSFEPLPDDSMIEITCEETNSGSFEPLPDDSTQSLEDETFENQALQDEESETPNEKSSWSRRYARTLEEGIRRETASELFSLLNDAQIDSRTTEGRRLVERSFMGLINALADEHEDLDIDMTTVPDSPFWRKEVKEMRINFSRLGFKPIRLGGNEIQEDERELSSILSADEAFDKIDKDNSGTLDQEELAEALSTISDIETNKDSVFDLASKLVGLYDFNGDGAVDRLEYQQMVEDMAGLKPEADEKDVDGGNATKGDGPLRAMSKSVKSISQGISQTAAQAAEKATQVASAVRRNNTVVKEPKAPPVKEYGSIVLSNLKIDLRRLVFGGVPLVKRIAPGGPLILEPFSVTLNGSFTREDVMGSFVLDAGLKLLVARALRVRARSFRDVVDGALFFGRKYKLNSKAAPMVEVLGLSNVEFDSNDKLVITGRAKIRTNPGAPIITQTFKLRTKIGTGRNGHNIRLVEPELAFVFECPKSVENAVYTLFDKFGNPRPARPEPIYSFFPIYSPFKVDVDENAGYDMGEDNRLKRIFIKDGKLRLEMTSVFRPGRFLGNHYLAFTVPSRNFIITLDRVKEGMRAARKNKKIAKREKRIQQSQEGGIESEEEKEAKKKERMMTLRSLLSRFKRTPKKERMVKPKSFFSRFVEGYTLVERENERLTVDISDWFGRQGLNLNSTRTGEV